jgi:transcriptional regulator with XRE-family HTH domain
MKKQHLWYHKLKREREIRGWSRAYVAERIGVEIKTVSRWERGEGLPQSRYRQDLVSLFGTNAAKLGLIEDNDPVSPSLIGAGQLQGDSRSSILPTLTTQDWGEAPHIEVCYGRQQESETLKRWILDDHCRMIAILGIGGIGKTTFTTMLAQQISDEFDYVIWRSLQNAPPLEQIIASCLQFVPEQHQRNQADDLNKQFTLLRSFLREYRCLLILDNVESIFETGQGVGRYANHHEGYGMLFQLLGETDHQSCLLLTSREKPQEMVHMEGHTSCVRTFSLTGIGQDDGLQLLKDKDLFGSSSDWARLITIYSGNPLMLKLVAEPIHEIFNGDIAGFLAGEEIVLGDIHDLIAQQLRRLTLPEKHLLYHLAIGREPISWPDLLEGMRRMYPKSVVLVDALDSLRRRSLVEISKPEGEDKLEGGSRPHLYIALQPMIREYVTKHFVEQAGEDIVEEELATTQDVEVLPQTISLDIGSEEEKKEISAVNSRIGKVPSLKEARLDHGWTQTELAGMVGVSERAYRAWERGDAYPSDLSLTRLRKVLGKVRIGEKV